MEKQVLLEVKDLSKQYVIRKHPLAKSKIIQAVDQVSFSIANGDTVGLIGESGSGKSTLGNLILRLIRPDRGQIFFAGVDMALLKGNELRRLRKDIQIIFQHSQDALDPKMTLEELLTEPLSLYQIVPPEGYSKEVERLLERVGLPRNEKNKFPYQLSGGQRQRVGIARAIASRPTFVVCDEPVSALDVSVQGQILNLLSDLKEELNLTYLFISHDLKIIRYLCDQIAVMYQGKLVEIGTKESVITKPQSSYTKQLIEAML